MTESSSKLFEDAYIEWKIDFDAIIEVEQVIASELFTKGKINSFILQNRIEKHNWYQTWKIIDIEKKWNNNIKILVLVKRGDNLWEEISSVTSFSSIVQKSAFPTYSEDGTKLLLIVGRPHNESTWYKFAKEIAVFLLDGNNKTLKCLLAIPTELLD